MELPEVILIGESKIILDSLLSIANTALGRSITRGQDAWGAELQPVNRFLCAIDEFLGGTGQPNNAIKNAGSSLRHYHLVFLILCTEEARLTLLENSRFHIASDTTLRNHCCLCVASGTLEECRDSVINLSTGREDIEVRSIVNKVMLCIEKMGIGQLWANFRRVPLTDSTIKLLPK